MSVLAQHVGHRTTLTDERHLRCVDCNRTLVLPVGVSTPASTSTSLPLGLNDPTACPDHTGQRKAFCGPCRSEQIAPEEASA